LGNSFDVAGHHIAACFALILLASIERCGGASGLLRRQTAIGSTLVDDQAVVAALID
jgi:hypothetical protein